MALDEKQYEDIFNMIILAGDARAYASEASNLADDYDFKSAEEKLKQAREKLVEAHNIQTSFMNKEASGEGGDINIFLVHAQDHFSMASMAIEFAEKLIRVYKKIQGGESI